MKKLGILFLIVSFFLIETFAQQKNKTVDPFDEAVKSFNSSDPYTRISAIDNFILLKDKRAVSYLKKGLKDNNTFVRQRSIDALGSLRSTESVKDIVEILLKDKDPAVQQSAVGALGVIGSPDALSAMHQVLKTTTTAVFVRYAICEKLRIFRSTTSVPVLISLLEEPDVKLRRSVTMSLNSIDHPEVILTLRKLLDSEKDEDFVSEIIMYLTNRQDLTSLPKIKTYLNSNQEKIQTYAAIGIAKLSKDTAALPILRKNLKNANVVIKNMVIEAVGFVGDRETLMILKKMFDEETDFYTKEMLKISISRIESSLSKPASGTKQ